jgi:hypothetical protein
VAGFYFKVATGASASLVDSSAAFWNQGDNRQSGKMFLADATAICVLLQLGLLSRSKVLVTQNLPRPGTRKDVTGHRLLQSSIKKL